MKKIKIIGLGIAILIIVVAVLRIAVSVNYSKVRSPLVSEDKNYLWFAGQQDKNVLQPNKFLNLSFSREIFSENISNQKSNVDVIKNIGFKRFIRWALSGSGLSPSYEGWDICFVYDQALASFVLTYYDDFTRAKRLFDFFKATRDRHIETWGAFNGFTDAYENNGRELETRAAGPNAWVLMALNYYMFKTGDMQYLELARDIADWLLEIQSIEGGIIGGYYGNGKPMTWISSEHNFDCYAALRDFGRLIRDDYYVKKAKDIKLWFEHDVWDNKNKRIYMGRNNKFYATDQSSWAILSLGQRYKETLDFAYKYSQCKHHYQVNDVWIEGFDFGSVYDTSPYPDKDAVWLEGTGHMVAALWLVGEDEKANYFLGELNKAETPSDLHRGATGLPYATNEGTPVFGSWLMQDRPLSTAGTAWYVFAKNKFNPFCMDQNLSPANNLVQTLQYEPDFHFVPVIDDFEYSFIKFETAYWDEYQFASKAEISKELVEEGANKYMLINFTADEGAKNSLGKIERRFMLQQDWSPYTKLSFRFKMDKGSKHILKIKVKDKEGEIYDIPVYSRSDEWQETDYDLTYDFSRDANDGVSYGNNQFDRDGVIAVMFEVSAKNSDGDTVLVAIDDIKLIK